SDGRTPLWVAVVRLLIDRGADFEAADKEYQTPLWVAVASGHEAVVRLLLLQVYIV
ncbi:hypothetical protein ACHAPT_013643, partial [Fusarium lateritium]